MNKTILKKSAIILFFLAISLIPHLSAAQNNAQNMPTQNAPVQKNLKNLTVICEKGCVKKPKTFKKAWTRLNSQLKGVEAAFKMPVDGKYKPMEVHIGFDSACGTIAPDLVEANIVKGFTHYKENKGVVICLNNTLKEVAAGFTPFAHELTHLYFNVGGNYLEEKLVMIMTPNIINPTARRPKSACSVAEPDQKFCAQYDLEYAKIPLFIKRLAKLRKQYDGQLTEADLADVLEYVRKK